MLVSVDVGTGSVRAGLFHDDGVLIDVKKRDIVVKVEGGGFVQSSEDIWAQTEHVLHGVLEDDALEGVSVGVDATCSLVVLDQDYKPVCVVHGDEEGCREEKCGASGSVIWNVIMWCDHRALSQAESITSTQHPCLKYVGGAVSPEMSISKLLFIKQNLPGAWRKAHHFMELPDYLTFKLSGSLSRSLCNLACKWLLANDRNKPITWDSDFLKQIGLGELTQDNCKKIGQPKDIMTPGLSLPLTAPIKGVGRVAASLIDAHCGALGALTYLTGSREVDEIEVEQRLVIIAGTSCCHIMLSSEKRVSAGCWGPYYEALLEDLYVVEAGQSAAGSLLHALITSHHAYLTHPNIKDKSVDEVYPILVSTLESMRVSESLDSMHYLTRTFHLYPDYHGNRSPLSDPRMAGMITGLTLTNINSLQGLALHYLAALQALAYSTKHILSSLGEAGHHIQVIHMCGGLAQNYLYAQLHADVMGLPVLVPHNEAPGVTVLRGGAILASCASRSKSLRDELNLFRSKCQVFSPSSDREIINFHQKKFSVFLKMMEHQLSCRRMME